MAEPVMPSAVTPHVGFFDRFAEAATRTVSRAWFFTACVLLVVLWLPSYFVLRDFNTWNLLINTATTIVTFLLVALLQNAQTRANNAVQHKLNAVAKALLAVLEYDIDGIETATDELRAAVGVERRESS